MRPWLFTAQMCFFAHTVCLLLHKGEKPPLCAGTPVFRGVLRHPARRGDRIHGIWTWEGGIVFYGWKLTAVGTFGNLMLQGGVFYVMNAFMEPMTAANGWSRSAMSFCMGIASICEVLSMPLAISLAMRFSIRRVMTAGAFAGGLAFIGLGHVTELWLFTILLALLWGCGQLCGGVVANLLISRWFHKYQGRAFGIVNMGASLAGAVVPFVALLLIDAFGLASAATVLGGCLLVFVPLCYAIVRDRPAEKGLETDGDSSSVPDSAPQSGVGVRELFRGTRLWIVGTVFGVALLCSSGVLGQLKPHFADIGMNSYLAMTCMCLTALCGAIGKCAWGWICDKTTPLFSAKLLILCNALSLLFILIPDSLWGTALFIVCFGVCNGGVWTVYPAVISYLYGRTQFFAVYRYASLFVLIQSLGYTMMGISYDVTGTYNMAYLAMIVMLLLSFAAIMTVREPESTAC